MDTLSKVLVFYYAVINIVLLILMGVDKAKAKKNKWRVKEATLIVCALLGGGIGGFVGMKLFHHKTRKWYFYAAFGLGIILHAILWWLILNFN